jgi:hypothetical protein
MAIKVQVTFDAADPPALAAFWEELIGYVEQAPPEGFDSWESWAVANDLPRERWDDYAARVDPDGVGPRLYFQRVPEPKTAKNRVHLDLAVSGGRGRASRGRRGDQGAGGRRGRRALGGAPGSRGQRVLHALTGRPTARSLSGGQNPAPRPGCGPSAGRPAPSRPPVVTTSRSSASDSSSAQAR